MEKDAPLKITSISCAETMQDEASFLAQPPSIDLHKLTGSYSLS
jgi:hypothetical protein